MPVRDTVEIYLTPPGRHDHYVDRVEWGCYWYSDAWKTLLENTVIDAWENRGLVADIVLPMFYTGRAKRKTPAMLELDRALDTHEPEDCARWERGDGPSYPPSPPRLEPTRTVVSTVRTVEVASSDGKSFYKVVLDRGTPISCTCQGYMFRRKCKHLQQALLLPSAN